MMIWFNLRCVIPTSKIVLNSEGMTSIVYCLYSNYHFCISHEVYVFLQSLFHIKFVCRSFYFVIDLLEYIWYTAIMEWETFFKTRTRERRVMIFLWLYRKDHHHHKMGMLIVQNGCGWGGVFVFSSLPAEKRLIENDMSLILTRVRIFIFELSVSR